MNIILWQEYINKNNIKKEKYSNKIRRWSIYYIIDTIVFYKTNSGLNTFIKTSIVSSNITNDYLKNRVNSKFDSSYELLSTLKRSNPNLICSDKKNGLLYNNLSFRLNCCGYNSDNEF